MAASAEFAPARILQNKETISFSLLIWFNI